MVSQLYFGLPLVQNGGAKAKAELPLRKLNAGSSENGNPPEPAAPILAQSLAKDENRFRLSTFDQLISPLRVDNPFGKLALIKPDKEIWAPKEIALFEACMCIYGKNFCNFG